MSTSRLSIVRDRVERSLQLLRGLGCAFLIATTMLACSRAGLDEAAVSISPSRSFFWGSGTSNAVLRVDVEQTISRPRPLDVFFLFDRTSSMTNVIETMQREAQRLMNTIAVSNPDSRFGVGLVADYAFHSPVEPGVRAWELAAPLDANFSSTITALQAIRMFNGGDLPEAYARGFHEAAALEWRLDAQRFIVFFGDAPAHDPGFYPIAGMNVGVDLGPDELPHTADDLTMAGVLDQLRRGGIAVIAIHESEPFFGAKPLFREAVDGLERIAESTGGVRRSVNDASEIPTAIEAAIRESYQPVPVVIPDAVRDTWAEISALRPRSPEATAYGADVALTVAEGTPSGIYDVVVRIAYADDPERVEVGQATIRLYVGLMSFGWMPLFWLLGIPVLLILLRLLAPGRMARGPVRLLNHSALYLGVLARLLIISLLFVAFHFLLQRVPEPHVERIGTSREVTQ